MEIRQVKARLANSKIEITIEGRYFGYTADIFFKHPVGGRIIRNIDEALISTGYNAADQEQLQLLVDKIKNDTELDRKLYKNHDIEY